MQKSLVLAAVVAALALSACGKKDEAAVEAQLKALAGRIVLSYGEATPEGQKFELA